eukprot:CAMPEP_0173442010 /NCGR_PEP_ID=MMETSP1357-20121228/24842_1 /TAXON_ID=77926 /ORGANISM="Hemiselmis rufescens, Strain PCC563" /LENGTH=46 /DNA_ID= /DNA_START= /DNA_END= /DNA_ORIENTATION=
MMECLRYRGIARVGNLQMSLGSMTLGNRIWEELTCHPCSVLDMFRL